MSDFLHYIFPGMPETKEYKLAREILTQLKGGEGSGNFGHAGRPGEVGGSSVGGSNVIRLGDKLNRDDVIQYITITNPPEQISSGRMTSDEWAEKYLSNDQEYEVVNIDPRAANLPADVIEGKVNEFSTMPEETSPPIVIDSNDKLEARFGGGKLDQAYGRQPDTVIDGKHRVLASINRGDKKIAAIIPKNKVKPILERSHQFEVDDFARDYFQSKNFPIIKFDGSSYLVNRLGETKTYTQGEIIRIAKNTGHQWRFVH